MADEFTKYELEARSYFGLSPNLEPSGFGQKFLDLCAVSDVSNLHKLRSAFPERVDAFIAMRESH